MLDVSICFGDNVCLVDIKIFEDELGLIDVSLDVSRCSGIILPAICLTRCIVMIRDKMGLNDVLQYVSR